MSNNKELEVLFHAFNIDNSFSSTKISNLFKSYAELSRNSTEDEEENFKRESLIKLIGLPSDKAWELAREEVYQAQDIGMQVISFLDENYPPQLLEISDPPLVLFITSKKDILKSEWEKRKIWGVVGARNPSRYGVSVALQLSSELSRNGITIISGLAYGIDKASHEGAIAGIRSSISTHCPTIAVLGSGLLEIYPSEHKSLAKQIIDTGGYLISEYGLRKTPRPFLFPRRNRIISGLSFGVIVIEAMKKSGSLITARLAAEQGREVYCLPGPIDSLLSEGVNHLIKEGAGVIVSIEDFVGRFAPASKKVKSLRHNLEVISQNFSAVQKKLIAELRRGDLTFDELIESGMVEADILRREIFDLELRGLVANQGGLYTLKSSKYL